MQQGSVAWMQQIQPPLVQAAKHREHMWLDNTIVWSYERPKTTQDVLFQCLAGARPKEAREAIEQGANAGAALEYLWAGVDHGKLQISPSAGPAYIWRSSPRHANGWARVYSPAQAAVASACAECVRVVMEHGANLEAALEWLVGLPPTVPRLEAGLVLCEVVDSTNRINRLELRDWLLRAKKWLQKHGQQALQLHGERVGNIHRGLMRVAPQFGLQYEPEAEQCAELL